MDSKFEVVKHLLGIIDTLLKDRVLAEDFGFPTGSITREIDLYYNALRVADGG